MRRAASAPGKVILFGEHFVVYGKPALVVAIGLRARAEAEEGGKGVELAGWSKPNPAVKAAEYVAEKLGYGGGIRLRIESEIPLSVGLGSSASVSVASAAAVSLLASNRIDLPLVLEAGMEGERIAHYNPSGIDPTIAALGGGGVYVRGEGLRRMGFKAGNILLVDTGKTRRTGEMVARVRRFAEMHPERFKALLEEAERLVWEAVEALKAADTETLGRLMLRNQEMLREVGVSSPEIEEAVRLCLRSGALGAKLTGGGGGGCVIAVADEARLRAVAERVGERFRVMVPRLMAEGVREEES